MRELDRLDVAVDKMAPDEYKRTPELDAELDRDLVTSIIELERRYPERLKEMADKDKDFAALADEVIAAQDPEHRFHDDYAALVRT